MCVCVGCIWSAGAFVGCVRPLDAVHLVYALQPCHRAGQKLYGPRCNCSFQAASSSWGPYLQAELNTSYMLVELLCTLEALPPLCGWVRSEGSGSGDEMVRCH